MELLQIDSDLDGRIDAGWQSAPWGVARLACAIRVLASRDWDVQDAHAECVERPADREPGVDVGTLRHGPVPSFGSTASGEP